MLISIRFALITAGILFLSSYTASAQDKIYLDDGSIIDAKVKEINNRSIVYRRWDNQDGADYILTRKEVSRIVYQNGTEEKLVDRSERPNPFNRDRSMPVRDPRPNNGQRERSRGMEPGYGKNILAIAPMQMTNESVAGVGVHYERFLDKAGIFSLYLPIAISFYDDEISPTGGQQSRTYTTLYPGAKIYPGGSDRRVSYSVGPSFGLGFGTQYDLVSRVDPGTGMTISRYEDVNTFKAGFLVNNGLNIQPTKQLYIGLEFGFGILYYSNRPSRSLDYDEPMVQFNFKMGYRF